MCRGEHLHAKRADPTEPSERVRLTVARKTGNTPRGTAVAIAACVRVDTIYKLRSTRALYCTHSNTVLQLTGAGKRCRYAPVCPMPCSTARVDSSRACIPRSASFKGGRRPPVRPVTSEAQGRLSRLQLHGMPITCQSHSNHMPIT